MWIILIIVALVTALLSNKRHYRWFYILAKTFRRDIRATTRYIKLAILLQRWQFRNNTVGDIFTSLVKKHPQKVAFYFEDSVWTFAQVDEFSNRIARHFQNRGLKKGDNVALLLENRPEYPIIWLGFSKIGVVTAFINTNLVSETLLHSLKVSNCKLLIFGSNHSQAVKQIQEKLPGIALYQLQEEENQPISLVGNSIDLRKELKDVKGTPVKSDSELGIKDPLVYIYTSGTTGLPKAAVITHMRFIFMATSTNCMTAFSPNDIIYNPLPLYHTAGGMVGIGQTFLKGLSVVIRKNFSASNYWHDCARYNCTISQYVGEICRYILAAPQKEPVKHCVRAMVGNGLRPQIWTQFVEKYNIKEMFEVYGATESISNLINIDNTVGAVGFIPRYLKWLYPVTLIKCNEVTGEPIRNARGLCIPCQIDEPGLIIGKIKKGPFEFKGYSSENSTQKKILTDVFKKGDRFFNSGDILVCDEFGTFFFRDRTGDTFRWKGENVSTTEVEGTIINIVQLNDAVVYGVEIPGTEGKAGMAAIVDAEKTLNLDKLTQGMRENLPAYAIPIFIRVLEAVPLTGTYKLKKLELQAEGYNIEKIKDSIYLYTRTGKYVPLTKEIYQQILDGNISV